MKRKYVLTMVATTDDTRMAALLRTQLKRLAGSADPFVGVKVTTQVQDGEELTEPVVLMERIVE